MCLRFEPKNKKKFKYNNSFIRFLRHPAAFVINNSVGHEETELKSNYVPSHPTTVYFFIKTDLFTEIPNDYDQVINYK